MWATVLAVCMFESRLGAERDMWELVVEKVNDWVYGVSLVEKGVDVEGLRELAREVLSV